MPRSSSTIAQTLYRIAPQSTKSVVSLGMRIPVEERFWSKVDKTESCWIWKGNTSGPKRNGKLRYARGYFSIGRTKKHVGATRFSFELANGPIPKGLFVCHKCDNSLCVRPDHLFLGTPQANTNDMIAKGRARHPTRADGFDFWSKLKEKDVLNIREYYPTIKSHTKLGKMFGISSSQVGRIINRESWAHLPSPQ